MPEYLVSIRETTWYEARVAATSPEEAARLVQRYRGGDHAAVEMVVDWEKIDEGEEVEDVAELTSPD